MATPDLRKFLGVPWRVDLLLLEDIVQTWLVQDLIPVMGRALLVAAPKTGKSLLAMQLAHHLATGTEWLGFPVPNQIAVHYIDCEIGVPGMPVRFRAMAQMYPDAGARMWMTSFPNDIRKAALSIKDVGLVVIDPAIKLGYINENDNAAVRKALDDVSDAVMQELGAATLVVHHMRKPSRDSAGGAVYQGISESRGAGAFIDWVDCGMDMLQVGEDFRLGFTVRGAAAPSPIMVSRDPDTLTYSVIGKAPDFATIVEEVLDEFRMREGRDPKKEELVEAIIPRAKRGRTTVYRLLKEMGYTKEEQ